MDKLNAFNKRSPRLIASSIPRYASWVEIDAEAINHNLFQYARVIQPALLAPVIKSNAYGHGIEIIAALCEQHPAVKYLCVASAREALFLRSLQIKKPILVLSIIDADLEDLILNDIDIALYQKNLIEELHAIAQVLKKTAYIHIKVDTGLSRLGFFKDEAISLIQKAHCLSFIHVRGLFTHFSDSESEDQSFTAMQLERFKAAAETSQQFLEHQLIKHAACSAASTAHYATHNNLVRVGIGMYGLWPSKENKKITLSLYPSFSLKPALTWKTHVIQIKEIPAGSYVGYDRTFVAQNSLRVATLPVGYWDGYDRHLSNKGKVLINNQIAPVIGRVAMNLMMIDVTSVNAAEHDEVTLLGNHAEITADDLAHICHTINYEIVTRINPLLPRTIK